MQPTQLKLHRLRSGLRQIELAQRAGVARCRLSELECGWVQPHSDELERIAKALGIDVAALCAHEGAAQ